MTELGYTDENNSKKKYVAPLIMLLLCMTAICGCAYAYNYTSTIESADQTIDAYGMEIQFAEGQSGNVFQADDVEGGHEVVVTTKSINGVTTAYFNSDPATVTVKLAVTITAEGEAGQCNLTSKVALDPSAWELTNVDPTDIFQSITITYGEDSVVMDYDTLTDDTATTQVIAEDISSGEYTVTVSIQTVDSFLLDGKANDDSRLSVMELVNNLEKLKFTFTFAVEN